MQLEDFDDEGDASASGTDRIGGKQNSVFDAESDRDAGEKGRGRRASYTKVNIASEAAGKETED